MTIQEIQKQIRDSRLNCEQARDRCFAVGANEAANYQDGWVDALDWIELHLKKLANAEKNP